MFLFIYNLGRLYAMQKGMEIDRKSPDCRAFLVALMDYLEKVKKDTAEEAIQNELVGQAHVENYALKVFLFADNEDRAARFNKNVVKSFYTAGMLFDVLSVFGELGEDVEKNKKYAKWKAAYIHKCLKSGETPIPGPMGGDDEDELGLGVQPGPSSTDYTSQSVPPPATYGGSMPGGYMPPQGPSGNLSLPTPNNNYPPAGAHAPPSTPQDPVQFAGPSQHNAAAIAAATNWVPPANPAGIKLNAEQYQKAMKYCKFASSSLQYEDSESAITNLTKALKVLTTGQDS